MMSELYQTEAQAETRKQLKKSQGYWICDKCGTKYYGGIICDPCLHAEFKAEVMKLKGGNRR
ncbi:hypothetical protein V1499_23015 (plasmid) [Neobacillus sp. SCS-31]|uniref:hypothetical protein n=1 Tax=Neobacillus oceani TaxID=3115292 RepID=UPI0039060449